MLIGGAMPEVLESGVVGTEVGEPASGEGTMPASPQNASLSDVSSVQSNRDIMQSQIWVPCTKAVIDEVMEAALTDMAQSPRESAAGEHGSIGAGASNHNQIKNTAMEREKNQCLEGKPYRLAGDTKDSSQSRKEPKRARKDKKMASRIQNISSDDASNTSSSPTTSEVLSGDPETDVSNLSGALTRTHAENNLSHATLEYTLASRQRVSTPVTSTGEESQSSSDTVRERIYSERATNSPKNNEKVKADSASISDSDATITPQNERATSQSPPAGSLTPSRSPPTASNKQTYIVLNRNTLENLVETAMSEGMSKRAGSEPQPSTSQPKGPDSQLGVVKNCSTKTPTNTSGTKIPIDNKSICRGPIVTKTAIPDAKQGNRERCRSPAPPAAKRPRAYPPPAPAPQRPHPGSLSQAKMLQELLNPKVDLNKRYSPLISHSLSQDAITASSTAHASRMAGEYHRGLGDIGVPMSAGASFLSGPPGVHPSLPAQDLHIKGPRPVYPSAQQVDSVPKGGSHMSQTRSFQCMTDTGPLDLSHSKRDDYLTAHSRPSILNGSWSGDLHLSTPAKANSSFGTGVNQCAPADLTRPTVISSQQVQSRLEASQRSEVAAGMDGSAELKPKGRGPSPLAGLSGGNRHVSSPNHWVVLQKSDMDNIVDSMVQQEYSPAPAPQEADDISTDAASIGAKSAADDTQPQHDVIKCKSESSEDNNNVVPDCVDKHIPIKNSDCADKRTEDVTGSVSPGLTGSCNSPAPMNETPDGGEASLNRASPPAGQTVSNCIAKGSPAAYKKWKTDLCKKFANSAPDDPTVPDTPGSRKWTNSSRNKNKNKRAKRSSNKRIS